MRVSRSTFAGLVLAIGLASGGRAEVLQPCADPDASGQTTVTDVFYVIRAAVHRHSCPVERCDQNCDGETTVTDALVYLNKLFCLIPEGCFNCCNE